MTRRIGFESVILLGALALPAHAQDAATPPDRVCLQGTQIEGTTVVDDNTVLYRMKDGKVWKNTLKAPCPNLKFERAFSEVIRGGSVCSNMQSITVLQTRNFCQLGNFTLQSTPTY